MFGVARRYVSRDHRLMYWLLREDVATHAFTDDEETTGYFSASDNPLQTDKNIQRDQQLSSMATARLFLCLTVASIALHISGSWLLSWVASITIPPAADLQIPITKQEQWCIQQTRELVMTRSSTLCAAAPEISSNCSYRYIAVRTNKLVILSTVIDLANPAVVDAEATKPMKEINETAPLQCGRLGVFRTVMRPNEIRVVSVQLNDKSVAVDRVFTDETAWCVSYFLDMLRGTLTCPH